MGNKQSVQMGQTLGSIFGNTDTQSVLQVRKKYSHFRILVIGRANAGKTTLLKRVCNTDEDPCIYDEENKNLLEPTPERGIHDVRRAFGFKSNPGFLFHDSPGFEAGSDLELKEVQAFIAERAKVTEAADQLHAIWFCFTPDISRPFLEPEHRFFNEARDGNVPVVVIFTKFDDLITQVYTAGLGAKKNRRAAEHELQNNFRRPLSHTSFPPRAYVRMGDLHKDGGDHQDQVNELMKETTGSLGDPALATLFVSIQQNNMELCIRYAVNRLTANPEGTVPDLVGGCMEWFGHTYLGGTSLYGETAKERPAARWDEQWPPEYWADPLVTNSHQVSTFLTEKQFEEPSYILAAAILICIERSFWYKSKSNSARFVGNFKQAFEAYNSTGTNKKVEKAVKALGDGQYDGRKREEFVKIILKYRLPHPA